MVPHTLRGTVLKLAHDIPVAGHLAKGKMSNRILQRLWWPHMERDIKMFCKLCPACQLTQQKPRAGAELIPMPLVDQPFDRIRLDIVGPLPTSAGGHAYILVMVDYATRYPEAVQLRTVMAKTLAKEFMQICCRLGIPCEVLTDQGTNFMSQTLKEMWKMLGVKLLRMSVYHPQANGLVEIFNKMLKG